MLWRHHFALVSACEEHFAITITSHASQLNERIVIMVYRLILALLLLGIVHVSLPDSGRATPIIFTDRVAFEAYVGASTLLPLDKPTVVADIPFSQMHITYNNILRLDLDLGLYLGYTSGPIGLNQAGLFWSGRTLVPVTAFGFDIISAHPNAYVSLGGSSYTVGNLNFLGLVSPDPVIVGMGGGLCGGGIVCPFIADNFTAKPVPEPSAVLLLAVGLAGLFGWHVRRNNEVHV